MEYRGYHFTNHALDRLDLRGISKDMVISVLQSPEKTIPTGKRDTTKFIRKLNGRPLHVVATHLKDQNRWLIVSVWARGENDPDSLSWQIITAPFKLVWWLITQFWSLINK